MTDPDFPTLEFEPGQVSGPEEEIERWILYARDYYRGYDPMFCYGEPSSKGYQTVTMSFLNRSCD